MRVVETARERGKLHLKKKQFSNNTLVSNNTLEGLIKMSKTIKPMETATKN